MGELWFPFDRYTIGIQADWHWQWMKFYLLCIAAAAERKSFTSIGPARVFLSLIPSLPLAPPLFLYSLLFSLSHSIYTVTELHSVPCSLSASIGQSAYAISFVFFFYFHLYFIVWNSRQYESRYSLFGIPLQYYIHCNFLYFSEFGRVPAVLTKRKPSKTTVLHYVKKMEIVNADRKRFYGQRR